MSTPHRIFKAKFSSVYPLYVQKAQKKGRTKQEVDQVIYWLTGYNEDGLQRQLELDTNFEGFFAQAPGMNPNRSLIKGVVCGIRVEEVEDPLMQQIRYLRKLPRQVDNSEVETSALNTLGLNTAGGTSPNDSCGRNSL